MNTSVLTHKSEDGTTFTGSPEMMAIYLLSQGHQTQRTDQNTHTVSLSDVQAPTRNVGKDKKKRKAKSTMCIIA